MSYFEKDGEIYKQVPAGGHGGGVTSSVPVKATEAEAAAFRASLETAGEPDREAVQETGLRQDGPTIREWIAEGYKASAYPPSGYESKSSPEDIAAAVAAEIEVAKAKGSA